MLLRERNLIAMKFTCYPPLTVSSACLPTVLQSLRKYLHPKLVLSFCGAECLQVKFSTPILQHQCFSELDVTELSVRRRNVRSFESFMDCRVRSQYFCRERIEHEVGVDLWQ